MRVSRADIHNPSPVVRIHALDMDGVADTKRLADQNDEAVNDIRYDIPDTEQHHDTNRQEYNGDSAVDEPKVRRAILAPVTKTSSLPAFFRITSTGSMALRFLD